MPLNIESLAAALDEHDRNVRPRLKRLWNYYRNPMTPRRGYLQGAPGRSYRVAQEIGLPSRIAGFSNPALTPANAPPSSARREIVVENDIGWRIQSMVDFMFGKPVRIVSTARTESLRRDIERALDAVWEGSGGIALLQDIALLGHVYGHIDLILRPADPIRPYTATPAPAPSLADDAEHALRTGRLLRIESIEPTRGVPILDPQDYRRLLAYLIDGEVRNPRPATNPDTNSEPLPRPDARPAHAASSTRITEVLTPQGARIFRNGRAGDLVANELTPGALPIVHIQNIAQPFRYEGQGEVEPLIPLQDELNTRLSDRACRVTLQCFKMYLAKGIDGFEKVPIAPGLVWTTDNPQAQISEFGGDADSPSEAAHIQEIREAMDKISGVPPLASGVVRAKIGNLTSANALKITMMGILSKTARKRVTYGRGIAEMSRLILAALDRLGVLTTDEADRGVRLEWPDPLPVDLSEQVRVATVKSQLGMPRDRLLTELGYRAADDGVA